jgi:mRNA interferase RelE/StbE
MFSLHYSQNAKRALKNLDTQVGKRIYLALESIRDNPRSHIEEMKRPKGAEPLYKYRVGEYRVIMALFDNELVVLVVDIGPRRTIYKKYGGKG